MAMKARKHEEFKKFMFQLLFHFVCLCVIASSWQKTIGQYH
jgi:hypothetical protein